MEAAPLDIDEDSDEYWMPVETDSDEIHPRLLQEIKTQQYRMKLYVALVYEGEEGVPNGKTIEFAIDAALGVACGVVRQFTATDLEGGYLDVTTKPIWFSCINDPDEVADMVHRLAMQPAI